MCVYLLRYMYPQKEMEMEKFYYLFQFDIKKSNKGN